MRPLRLFKNLLLRCPLHSEKISSKKEDHEERGSKDRAASTCGPHSDPFNDTSRVGFHKQFPDTLQKQIINPSALSVHSL
ncbi:hypothetical protein TNCV_3188191 [Trichonephila clavipes]|nr:hypothetical protein TNCV_3188191 [Trichonephila clavipes]